MTVTIKTNTSYSGKKKKRRRLSLSVKSRRASIEMSALRLVCEARNLLREVRRAARPDALLQNLDPVPPDPGRHGRQRERSLPRLQSKREEGKIASRVERDEKGGNIRRGLVGASESR